MSRKREKEKDLRIIFFGTSTFAEEVLTELLGEDYDIKGVVTTPDKPRGRGRKIGASPVKVLVKDSSRMLFAPENLTDEGFIENLLSIEPDLFVVASYGKILPPKILNIPKYGSINIHASLLPHYRGASPICQAILDGCSKTGVTIIAMNDKMDAGDILMQNVIEIHSEDTQVTLSRKLSRLGTSTLIDVLRKISTGGMVQGVRQDEREVTRTKKIRKEDGKINWKDKAVQIERAIRAYQPWPIAHATYGGKLFKIFKGKTKEGVTSPQKAGMGEVAFVDAKGIVVGTGEGLIVIEELQMEGRPIMSAEAFLRGHVVKIGDIFQ